MVEIIFFWILSPSIVTVSSCCRCCHVVETKYIKQNNNRSLIAIWGGASALKADKAIGGSSKRNHNHNRLNWLLLPVVVIVITTAVICWLQPLEINWNMNRTCAEHRVWQVEVASICRGRIFCRFTLIRIIITIRQINSIVRHPTYCRLPTTVVLLMFHTLHGNDTVATLIMMVLGGGGGVLMAYFPILN